MELGDEDRFRCMTFFLKDDAALWFEGVEKTVDVTTLTWEAFKTLFYEKYYTPEVRAQLKKEFMSLRQGDMTVSEFVWKFERNCHFVPLIGNDEAEKLQHFVACQRPNIRRDAMMVEPVDYAAAIKKAMRSEQSLKDFSAEVHSKRTITHQGRILVAGVATRALLDSGATHSFISEAFTFKWGIECEDLFGGFTVTIPSGKELSTRKIVKNLEILLQGQSVTADLIVLPMPEFDMIFGMDWMTKNVVMTDFQQRSVVVKPEGEETFWFETTRSLRRTQIISFTQAKKLVHDGCEEFLASISLIL
ncbi:uncharacterized protein [Henckelia pumila]|uniref:uncharacterized protein n=1 Tax=Henckelia pumila TaxID=405737 RepID=UPI003C6E579F